MSRHRILQLPGTELKNNHIHFDLGWKKERADNRYLFFIRLKTFTYKTMALGAFKNSIAYNLECNNLINKCSEVKFEIMKDKQTGY